MLNVKQRAIYDNFDEEELNYILTALEQLYKNIDDHNLLLIINDFEKALKNY